MKSELVERLLPGLTHDREYYEKLYPERNLGEKAIVTRYAQVLLGLFILAIYFSYIFPVKWLDKQVELSS